MTRKTVLALSRRFVVTFVASFAAIAVIFGGGAAVAYWTATSAATGAVNTAAVSIAQDKFPLLDKTYRNSSITAAGATTLANAGSFTVANTGEMAGSATVTIAGSGGLGANLTLRAWVSTAAAPCGTTVPGSGVSTGTWASTTIAPFPLAAGATATVCVLTTAERAATAATSGTASVTGTATVSLNADGWVATSATAASTQKTSAIFPLSGAPVPASGSRWVMLASGVNSAMCVDTWDGQQGVGAITRSYNCFEAAGIDRTNANRAWQLIPESGSSDRSLVTIRPAHAPDKRLGLVGDNGPGVGLMATSATETAEKWYIQQRSGSVYQLVNAKNGLCMAIPSSISQDITVAECDSSNLVQVVPSAPIQPGITRVAATEMKIDLGFHRLNVNGVKYTARVLQSDGTAVGTCTTMGLNYTPTPAQLGDATRTVTCTGVPTGTFTVEVVAASAPTQVIYKLSVTVTATSMVLNGVLG
ncbi:RICIN domain-containing protein [Microbacterium gorillae]|uniref:RICIN domain-containing protein n=1 Tax=Microbacterium gorillae TaxID=1231063 RepID=UPI00058AD0E9|nr:RICIN domain-containing protein [Microbacterium gorillae]